MATPAPAPTTRRPRYICRLEAGQVHSHLRGQGINRWTRSPSRPVSLPSSPSRRRHADRVEARPAGPQLARPDNDAGRPPRPWREIPFAHRSHRHCDAHRPRNVADYRGAGRARTVFDFRTDACRSEGSAAPGREVWPETEPHTRADRPRPKADRQRRSPAIRGHLLNAGRSTLYLPGADLGTALARDRGETDGTGAVDQKRLSSLQHNRAWHPNAIPYWRFRT